MRRSCADIVRTYGIYKNSGAYERQRGKGLTSSFSVCGGLSYIKAAAMVWAVISIGRLGISISTELSAVEKFAILSIYML